MPVFRKATEESGDAVNVRLWRSDNGIVYAKWTGPARLQDGNIVFAIGGDDMAQSVPEALLAASATAHQLGRPLLILDPDGLWKEEWGSLDASTEQ